MTLRVGVFADTSANERRTAFGPCAVFLSAILADNTWRAVRQRKGDVDAGTQAGLRMLQQGLAAGLRRRADLFFRMHVLRGLQRERIDRRLSELRRRAGAASAPSGEQAPEQSAVGDPRVQSRVCRAALSGLHAADAARGGSCHAFSATASPARTGATRRRRLRSDPCRVTGVTPTPENLAGTNRVKNLGRTSFAAFAAPELKRSL